MSTISDDLRAAALSLFMLETEENPDMRELRNRLRTHAETIERVEGELAKQIHDRPGPAQIRKWRDALRGDSNG